MVNHHDAYIGYYRQHQYYQCQDLVNIRESLVHNHF